MLTIVSMELLETSPLPITHYGPSCGSTASPFVGHDVMRRMIMDHSGSISANETAKHVLSKVYVRSVLVNSEKVRCTHSTDHRRKNGWTVVDAVKPKTS